LDRWSDHQTIQKVLFWFFWNTLGLVAMVVAEGAGAG